MLKEAIEKQKITGDPDKLKKERKLIRDYCRNVNDFEGIQLSWDMDKGVPDSKGAFLFKIVDGEKKLIDKVY